MPGLRDYVDTDSIRQRFSCVDILAGRVELRGSEAEKAGPCPKCGGKDRLHVRRDGWFCRRCKPLEGPKQHWHDVIALVEWLDGVDFLEAVRRFDYGRFLRDAFVREDETLHPSAPKKPARLPSHRDDPQRGIEKRAALEGIIDAGCRRLDSPDGAPWVDYLADRCITLATARTWWLGAGQAKDNDGAWLPALILPWVDADIATGVKFRFLTGAQRYTSWGAYTGSFALNVFGRHVMGGAYDTLLMTEGELNAVSCWQAVRAAGLRGVDVVSIGSDSVPDGPALVELAGDFRRVVCWLDDPHKAQEVRSNLPGARVGKSPHGDDGAKLDANEMLRRGVLPDFLRAILG